MESRDRNREEAQEIISALLGADVTLTATDVEVTQRVPGWVVTRRDTGETWNIYPPGDMDHPYVYVDDSWLGGLWEHLRLGPVQERDLANLLRRGDSPAAAASSGSEPTPYLLPDCSRCGAPETRLHRGLPLGLCGVCWHLLTTPERQIEEQKTWAAFSQERGSGNA